MLNDRRIIEIAADLARAQVLDSDLERVLAEPTTDSEGNEALRITFVLKPDAVLKLTGDRTLDLLLSIQDKLWYEGEERLPMVEYATQSELDRKDDLQEND